MRMKKNMQRKKIENAAVGFEHSPTATTVLQSIALPVRLSDLVKLQAIFSIHIPQCILQCVLIAAQVICKPILNVLYAKPNRTNEMKWKWDRNITHENKIEMQCIFIGVEILFQWLCYDFQFVCLCVWLSVKCNVRGKICCCHCCCYYFVFCVRIEWKKKLLVFVFSIKQ